MSATRVRFASRPDWKRVTKRKFSVWSLEQANFTGYVTRLDLLEVSSPLWVQSCGEQICVADTGYSWLQHFPFGTHYTLKSQWNARGEIIQWYFDMCDHHGLIDGVPYWEDLYLDIIGLPNGIFEMIDQDELEQGLTQHHITLSQYTLAQREAKHLLQLLQQGKFELLETAKQHYQGLVIDK